MRSHVSNQLLLSGIRVLKMFRDLRMAQDFEVLTMSGAFARYQHFERDPTL